MPHASRFISHVFFACLTGLRAAPLLIAFLACTTAFPAPKKPVGRFLFVVETSSAMLPFDHAGRQVVFDFVFDGIGNQIQQGDTIGLWNFGKEVHGGVFPMQVWDPEQNLQLASNIGLFLKNQHYDNQGRFDHLVAPLLTLMKTVQDVNILIVSAQHTWSGIPLDSDLNRALQQKASESLVAKTPLITTLVVRKGAVTNWFVTLAGEPIVLPKPVVPEPPKAPVVENHKPAPLKSIVITSDRAASNVEAEPGGVRIVVSNRVHASAEPQPPLPVSDAVVEAKRRKEDSPAGSSDSGSSQEKKTTEPLAKTATLAPATQPKPAPESSSSSASIPAALSMLAPNTLVVAAREKPVETNAPTPGLASPALALSVPPQPFLSPRSLFLLGAAFMAVALILLILAVRFVRRATRPSFITQSLEREGP